MHEAAGEMNLYPDGAGYYLKNALSERLGVKPEEIVLGNGSDELMALLAQAYLNPKRELITSAYSFVRYPMVAGLVGAKATLVPMKDMCHDLEGLAAAVTPATALICLDLPGNPTGTIVSKRALVKFLKSIPPEVMVVLDQAYFEFAEGDPNFPDGFTLRRQFPNLIVMRTFSKAYGLAGLRIGYAVARPEIIDGIERVRPPFNANRMVQAAALAALDDKAHLRKAVQNNTRGLELFQKGFKALGLKSWPSWANFILVDIGRDCRQAFTELLKLGVVTRPMAGYGLTTFLRISIGTPAENRRCLAALKQVLKG
jgi:histidinol-phosphate aminotransferase